MDTVSVVGVATPKGVRIARYVESAATNATADSTSETVPPAFVSVTTSPLPIFAPAAFRGVMVIEAADPTITVSGVDVNVEAVIDGDLSATGGGTGVVPLAVTVYSQRPAP
jgi:hypothetical protein